MKKVLIFVLLLTALFIAACCIKYNLDRKNLITLPLDYNESSQSLKNPERGWYSIVACSVNDNYSDTETYNEALETLYQEGDTLVQVLFNLVNYRGSDISENGLQYIDRMMKNIRNTGLQAIVRFEYDWDGKGEQLEPDRIETVLKHMDQVGPILNNNKNAIYLLQGIFVGSYGEMHGSKFLSQKDVKALLNKYLEVTDDSLLLSVRSPAYWREFAQSNDPLDGFTKSPYARIGLYNDGLCSSDTDLGTYNDGSATDNGYSENWVRQEELEFQSRLCQFVPNGGEVALLSDYNEFNMINNTFPQMHISYLNRMYNTEVLDQWKKVSYHAKDSEDAYNGLDGYKYIGDHLGYRFVLKEVTVPQKAYSTNDTVIHIAIENTGYANVYHEKNVDLILQNTDNNECLTYPVDVDVRNLRSGVVSGLDITIPTKAIKEGSYEMYFKISNAGESSIRMANDRIYNEKLQANAIGTLKVQKLTLKNLWDL